MNGRRALLVTCLLVHGLVIGGGVGTAEARSHKLKATGLAQPKLVKSFAKHFKKELSEWPRRTLKERAKSLARVANAVLKELAVPNVKGQAWQEQKKAYGAYRRLPDEEAAFMATQVLGSIWQEVK